MKEIEVDVDASPSSSFTVVGGGSKSLLPSILEDGEAASHSVRTLAEEKFIRAMSTAAVRRALDGDQQQQDAYGFEDDDDDEDTILHYDSRTISLSQSQSQSLKMSQSFISAQFASLSQSGSYQAFQEENEPVERQIFKEHTRCFGLLFRTWRIERIFLDGHARLHKNIVHLGFLVVFIAALLLFLGEQLRKHYNDFTCTKNQDVCDLIFSYMTTYIGGESIPWYFIPCFAAFSIAGSGMQWYVHRSEKVKEKSWAMLCTFVLYFVTCIAGGLAIVAHDKTSWPSNFLMGSLACYITFIFFAGTTSFTPFLVLWIEGLAIFLVSFPIARRIVNKESGETSQESITLLNGYVISLFWFLVLAILFLVGAFLLEIASRKRFLRRILLHSQQNQIIKEKTKNEALQKKLLENIFPQFIVDQLQQQNFTVGTWDQLRALSHRHLGVSIMFADLENFTSFSSQVDPPHVMEYLNNLFQIFDSTCDDFDVYKVETVGDQYVAAVGVVTGRMLSEKVSHKDVESFQSQAEDSEEVDLDSDLRETSQLNTIYMIDFAKAIIAGSRKVVVPEQKADLRIWPALRVGIHTGSCMSGIVGNRTFRFCLFGDTMNTAARMQQKSLAECIHTTKEVVALAPKYSWEKLKKMEVKGKGSMQTYLLRVGRELDSIGGRDTAAEANADVSFALNGSEYYNPLFQTQAKEGGGGGAGPSISILGGGSIVSSKTGSRRYQDIPVVSREVYLQHSKWFGLVFKSFFVEIAFLDGQAMLYKNVVYLGYILFVVVLLLNLLFGYILCMIINNTCQIAAYAETCLLTFGAEVLQRAQDPQNLQNSYNDIINQSLFRMTPAAGGILAGLLLLGSASHWYIHKHFKHKSWALLNVFVFYGAILITMYIFICIGVPDQIRLTTWIYSMGAMSMIVATLFAFFSGASFTFYFSGALFGACLYVAFATPVIMKARYRAEDDEYEYGMAVFASSVLFGVSVDLVIYCLLLILGCYLMDSTHRKTFLQRTLLVKQQEQIIKEKTKNESMQKLFLENILPSFLVGKLKEPREARAGLSQRHVGVSMLFADLVGFTTFSSQVDPFKVMIFLNDLFQVFDSLCDQYNIYKVETVGDSYVAAVGVITGQLTTDGETLAGGARAREKASLNAKDAVGFAKAMIRGSRMVIKPEVNTPAIVRIGIHTGSCISGIIGTKNLKFSLLGDMVVTAAHMEQLGKPDCIHASQQIVDITPEETWERNKVVKLRGNRMGKEESIQTYLLTLP